MKNFVYQVPTEYVFGKGVEDKTVDYVKKYGGTKVILIYGGGSVVRSGLLANVEKQLADAGIAYLEHGGVQPNPALAHVREGVQKALDFGADMVLAVGGGSAIDAAKAIAHGAANPERDVWDWFDKLKKLSVPKTLPLGVVLTMAATGSESSDSCVITDNDAKQKLGLTTQLNRPLFAIMNPEFQYTLPDYQMACGITDILMHTVERYFSCIQGNELTDAIAESLMRNVIKNGRIAMKERDNYQAQSELMWCGSLSHVGLTGLGNKGDFVTHIISQELSGHYGLAHGAALTVMWPAWTKYVLHNDPARFARYAVNVWGVEEKATVEETAQAGIDAQIAFFKELGLPTCMSETEYGVRPDSEMLEMADMCCGFGRTRFGSFMEVEHDDVYKILQLCNV